MVSTMSPADAWQQSGMPSDHPYPSGRTPRFDRERSDYGPGHSGRGDSGGGDYAPRSSRSAPPPPRSRSGAAADRGRSADRVRAPERRYSAGEDENRRPPVSRRPEAPRPRSDRPLPAERRPADPRASSSRPPRGDLGTAETGGSRLRGLVAVLAVFLVTLAACGADSYLGSGLGTITLIALVGSTALATLLVRRRDIVSVIVAPPLVFVAVAVADVAAAPSASFSLATLATLLIRGFPAMGIATGLALIIGLIRLAARR
jgi:hypothetical protein